MQKYNKKNKLVSGVSSQYIRKMLIPFTTAEISIHFAFIAEEKTPYIHRRLINLKKETTKQTTTTKLFLNYKEHKRL